MGRLERHAIRAALLAGIVAAASFIAAAPAAAAGVPNIQLSKQAPASVLYGATSPVTLSASNPSGEPTGYNLSFRDVLPEGISYVAGSAPAVAGEPQVIANAPATGQTTLIWSNLADLTAASSFSFSYRVAHSQALFDVGDSYTNNAGAYINCNPRYVPDFNALGVPTQSGGDSDCDDTLPEESYTGSATASATTEISAIEITKAEPSPEGELLRGLHDQQTTYTLTLTNNLVNSTLSVDVEDYLPAGLEFLGCGGADNTTDAPTNPGSTQEYAGSGAINPGNEPGGGAPAGCVAPDVVETVADPPGLPAGVYTHVVWNDLADLAPSGTRTLRYLAAIPLRANTLDWNGAAAGLGTAPDPALGKQASNLDNNSGPETYEDIAVEPSFTNLASADGLYQDGSAGGLPVSDEATATVTSEDLRILKSVSSGGFSPGATSTWTLRIDTGEYRYVDDLVVTDTLGDGYCPLGSTNLEPTPPAAAAECDPTGAAPSAPYESTQENPDGTWTIVWDKSTDSALGRLQPSTGHTITFPTKTRTHYQANRMDEAPILARDDAANSVDVEGVDFIRCAPGAPDACAPGSADKIDADEPDAQLDTDKSSAGQQAPGASIDKRVDSTPNSADCLTGTYVDGPPSTVAPGDHVCFRVRMDFPGTPETGSVAVTDFIPPGTTYDVGSAQATSANTVAFATASTTAQPDVAGPQLVWPLDDGGGAVQAAAVFEVVFSVTVQRRSGVSDGDITDNLEKAVFTNSDGQSFPLRDQAGLELAQAELTLLKGVRDVNDQPPAGNGPNLDGVTARPGDTVTYRVDIRNGGSIDATSAEVWDVLPPEVACADVVAASISDGGSCNVAEDRIEWTSGIAVSGGGSKTLTYDVVVPEGLAPLDVLTNTAGVRSYESPGGGGSYTNIPSDNIDPTLEPQANAGPADDPSNVVIESAAVVKTRTTELTEPGNNDASQATIGEEIYYTVTATVPAGTTLFGTDTSLDDDVGTRQTLDLASVSATLDVDGTGGAPPVSLPSAGLTLSASGSAIRIDFPDPYVNVLGSGDDIVTLTFTTTVDDDFPDNQARGTSTQQDLPNTAQLSWEDAVGTARSAEDTVSTRLVEPDVSLTKANDAAGPVAPGDIVGYTLTASNGGPATGTTVAHDLVVEDTVPVGLTPVNAGVPVPPGGTVDPDGGVWNEGARTITWTLASLAPGASADLDYELQLDPDAIGAGTLLNSAELTATSLPDGLDDDGERTAGSTGPSPGVPPPGYADEASSSLTLVASAVIKASAPNQRAVGDVVTHTVTVTVPPQIQQFDAVVVDDLPDGLAFDSYVSAICTAGCAAGPTDIAPVALTPVPNGDGTRIGWSFGDIASATVARTVELKYRTHVEESYAGGAPVQDGDVLRNTATLAFNTANDPGPPPTTPPDPADYDERRTDSADTDVVEPELVIDKDVSGDPDDDDLRDAQPGQSFTYTLRVTNTGTGPAFDVVVSDQPDAELTNVVVTQGAAQLTDSWSAADPDMSWLLPGPIAPGDTVELVYTADQIGSAQLQQDQQVINTADIPSYFGVPEAGRQQNGFDYIEYDDVAPDTVTITLKLPALELIKTTGAPSFPDDAPGAIETSFPWRIVITNPNAGSLLLGVDLTDALPANWSYVAGSAQISGTGDLTPGGQVDPAASGGPGAPQLVWSDLADLEGGETVIVEFEAEPSPLAAINPGTGAANANLNDASAVGQDGSGAVGSADGPYSDSDDATATLAVPSFDLGVTKTAGRSDPPAGSTVTWTVTVTNNGPDSAPDVTVSDTLPPFTSFVSAVPQRGSCNQAAGIVSCGLGTLSAGDSVEILIRTSIVREAAGQDLTNGVNVAGAGGDDTDPSNDDDEAGIDVPTVAETCAGGALALTPGSVWAGVRTRISARVTNAAGDPVQFAPVELRLESGVGQISAAPVTRETDAQGIAVFEVKGQVGARWVASVAPCNLNDAVTVRSSKSCGGLTATPASLTVGRGTKIKVRLRAPNGKPMSKIKVRARARGKGVKKTAVTNRAGRVTFRNVRIKGAGVVRVSAPKATKCVVRLGAIASRTGGGQLTG